MAERVARLRAADIHRGRPVLVLAPHADDESLGCGALLAECFATVGAHIVCVTDGARSHPRSRLWPAGRLAALRRDELRRAVSILGGSASDITFLRYPDCGAPDQPGEQARAARRLAGLCRDRRIGAVLTPSPRDPHRDHRATFAIARHLVRLVPALRLFAYPVWSRWHARHGPGVSEPLALRPTAARIALKRRAIEAHRSQRGQIVTDDPDGFTMPDGFVEFFAASAERYRQVRP